MSKVVIIGSGLIGRAWAIVFARAGWQTILYDSDPSSMTMALDDIRSRARELQEIGLVKNADDVVARISTEEKLENALIGADYVQENGPEDTKIKIEIFSRLDDICDADTILASSSSGIPASRFTQDISGRHRCLIAHPVNPPYLVPLVEIVPAPWTENKTIEKCNEIMKEIGQTPVVVKGEIPGFILNRLQGALLSEALRLVNAGFASPTDIDKTVSEGLGLRWSFIGPFETIDLNAPGGLKDYCDRYGAMYESMPDDLKDVNAWAVDTINAIDHERRATLPMIQHGERQAWRDKRLMALILHKSQQKE